MNTRSSLLVASLAVLALIAPAGASAPAPGTYSGRTSQKLAISITVKQSKVTALHFKVANNCGEKHKPIDVTGGSVKIHSDGRFSMSLGNASGSLKVAGRFTGRKAVGTLREKAASSLLAHPYCDTGIVHWAIHR
jgi:hypothetical protein